MRPGECPSGGRTCVQWLDHALTEYETAVGSGIGRPNHGKCSLRRGIEFEPLQSLHRYLSCFQTVDHILHFLMNRHDPVRIANHLHACDRRVDKGVERHQRQECFGGSRQIAARQVEQLAVSTGMAIKAGSPVENTVVMGLVNGAAKYMAAADAYDRFTYEAMNSFYTKGSAEALADRIGGMLSDISADLKK